ncbi:D-sedoheptulose-7-phosphate isomerase [Candidatus Methylobacter favarea]|uniref:D-sedoheptulose-7-phosphate isomerase n=1 Tax=Candidatus Methylobacter favarea TaxID=2707345 RepID=UPI0024839476|nr:D-sedoheptulose 7-phosphate isomerase [Candidatus Methylobacter favarea]
MRTFIRAEVEKSVSVFSSIHANEKLLANVEVCVEEICLALKNKNKVLLAGNGGSAADAQHIAGEFVSRFNYDRPGLAAFALTVDTSILTAIGNDYGYEKLFARQLQAVGLPGDIFWAYSTSGKSPNVIAAMETAKQLGLKVIGFTGANGWSRPGLCDFAIEIPSAETPKVQEGHLLLGHIICGLVELKIFPRT